MTPPDTAIDLRDFRPGDEHAVITLWRKCRLLRPWNDPYQDIRRKLAAGHGGFWVGHVGSRLIASIMVGYDGHRGSVNYLAIDPAFSGHGHGRMLMERAEAFLFEKGCPKVNMCVRRDNGAVLAFYSSLAYEQDDVVVLGKRLIPDD
jgi:ribosomal protein S18 acetylase RimI-like enzyme